MITGVWAIRKRVAMKVPILCLLIVALFSGSESIMVSTITKFAPFVEECVSDAYPPSASRELPTYVINLDLPPQQRWAELMLDKKAETIELLQVIKNLTEPVFHGKLFKFIDYYLPKLAKTLPYPFSEELQGISDLTEISLGEVTLYNIFYEIFTVCTSIIAEDGKGKLHHVRNLDFGLFMGWDTDNHTWIATEVLRKLVVLLDFQRGGKTVFKSVNFAGYVGILTGMKPNTFAVTVDERFKLKGGFIGIIEWILGHRSGSWMGFLTRNVMENATTYSAATKILAKTELLAPVYFIVSGNSSGEGCVITRDLKKAEIWVLGTQNSSWFMVETNYDHWEKPPFFDDRRTPAIKCLNEMSQQNLSLSGLFNVLSSKPVLNKLTVYSALMITQEGYLKSYLQYCEDPCSPW